MSLGVVGHPRDGDFPELLGVGGQAERQRGHSADIPQRWIVRILAQRLARDPQRFLVLRQAAETGRLGSGGRPGEGRPAQISTQRSQRP